MNISVSLQTFVFLSWYWHKSHDQCPLWMHCSHRVHQSWQLLLPFSLAPHWPLVPLSLLQAHLHLPLRSLIAISIWITSRIMKLSSIRHLRLRHFWGMLRWAFWLVCHYNILSHHCTSAGQKSPDTTTLGTIVCKPKINGNSVQKFTDVKNLWLSHLQKVCINLTKFDMQATWIIFCSVQRLLAGTST
jgi:hypothetical protein